MRLCELLHAAHPQHPNPSVNPSPLTPPHHTCTTPKHCQVGAIIADVAFSYVSDRMKFVLSAIFGLVGVAVTSIWLPDTTGMDLDELDRWNKYLLAGEAEHYHGACHRLLHVCFWGLGGRESACKEEGGRECM